MLQGKRRPEDTVDRTLTASVARGDSERVLARILRYGAQDRARRLCPFPFECTLGTKISQLTALKKLEVSGWLRSDSEKTNFS